MNGTRQPGAPKPQREIDNVQEIINQSKDLVFRIREHLGLLDPSPETAKGFSGDLRSRISTLATNSKELLDDLAVIKDYLQTL